MVGEFQIQNHEINDNSLSLRDRYAFQRPKVKVESEYRPNLRVINGGPMKPRRTTPDEATSTDHQENDISNDSLEPIRVKIISLGDVKVGKSCVIKKHCEPNRFNSIYIPTIGVDYGVKAASKKMNDGNMLDIKIDFFDLSGDTDYYEVRNEFYSNADGVLLMFDVTSKQSFESLTNWLEEAAKFGLSQDGTTLVVMGNKIDQYPRAVTEQEGTSFAMQNNAVYFETSAKTGVGVEDVFDYILADTCKKGFYN
ncbi:hypothetical protein ACHAXR_002036 [Thalassiosira sp. AJA248-18]